MKQGKKAGAIAREVEHASVAPRSVKTPTSAERVIEDVIEGVRSNRYRRGQRVYEADLTQRLGVARGSVREAFVRLEADGIIESGHHRGARIRTLSRAQTIESLELLEVVLGLAARRAADRIARGDGAVRLSRALSDLLLFPPLDLCPEHRAARTIFFDTINDIAGAVEIARIVPSLLFCRTIGAADFEAIPIVADHADFCAITAAILAADGILAAQAMQRHVHRMTTAFMGLDKAGE